MENYKFLILGFFIIPLNLMAQNSMLEDAEGEGSFKIYSSTISVNTGESAIKSNIIIPIGNYQQGIDYYSPGDTLRAYRIIIDDYTSVVPPDTTLITVSGIVLNPGQPVRRILYQSNFINNLGFNINTIASDGVGNIFSEGNLKPKGEFKVFYSHYGGGGDQLGQWDYWTFSGGINAAKVSLINPTDLLQDPTLETNIGFNAEVNYNRVGSIFNSNTLFGIGVSYNNSDNSSTLSKLEYKHTITFLNSNNQTITQDKSITGYDVNSYSTNQNHLNVNIDWGIYPGLFNDRLLVAAQIRGEKDQEKKFTLNSGLGFYLADEDISTKIIGGLNIIATDIFETEATDSSFKERISINLVAGFRLQK